MIDTRDALTKAQEIIDESIIREAIAQGHFLTGRFIQSFRAELSEDNDSTTLVGLSARYLTLINRGIDPRSASMKQFPFVVKYWMLRGLPEKEAKRAAAATIHTWMKEGVSTSASFRFSQTGDRQGFIEKGFQKALPVATKVVLKILDSGVQQEFRKTPSGTF